MNTVIKKMKAVVWIVLLCAVTVGFSYGETTSTLTPVGKWVQIDDDSGKPHSIIRIYEREGALFGKIEKGISREGEKVKKYCDLCQGALHNQPIVGLEILTNFIPMDDGVWGNGKILDPDTGKTYQCKLTLSPDGKILKVRGFIGISMLGRTQVWQRQEPEEDLKAKK